MISYDNLPFMEAISDAALFDGKDLIDAQPAPGLNFEAITLLYERERREPSFDLRAFAAQNLRIRDVCIGEGYIGATDNLVHHSYELLKANICHHPESSGTLIGLPYPYIKPCPGRFDNEQYANDTGEVIKGLAVDLGGLADPAHVTLGFDERYDLIESMIDNQVYLQNLNIGGEHCIPNANRTYYLRPQITHAASNIATLGNLWEERCRSRGEDPLSAEHPLIKYNGFLLKEWTYWNGGLRGLVRGGELVCRGVVRLDSEGVFGNVYRDGAKGPRLEVRAQDLATLKRAREIDPSIDADFFFDAMRRSAVSGMDHSSRFMKDYYNLHTMRTQHIVPVDLTAKLRSLEDVLRQSYELKAAVHPSDSDSAAACRFQRDRFRNRVAARDAMIERKHYDPETGFYYDWDYTANGGEGARTPVISTAGLFPLAAGAIPLERARRIEEVVREELLLEGGLQVTNMATPEQWDAEIGWAGQTMEAIDACRVGGLPKLGFEIADRWLTSATNAQKRTGGLPENLNVQASGKQPRGNRGEYIEQQNFSWTGASVPYAIYARAEFAHQIEYPAKTIEQHRVSVLQRRTI